MPYLTLEGMKTILAEMGRTRPEVLKYDAASMVDPSIIKAIDEERFLKRLGHKIPGAPRRNKRRFVSRGSV